MRVKVRETIDDFLLSSANLHVGKLADILARESQLVSAVQHPQLDQYGSRLDDRSAELLEEISKSYVPLDSVCLLIHFIFQCRTHSTLAFFPKSTFRLY